MKVQEFTYYTGLIVMELKLSHRRGALLSLPNQTSTFPSHSHSFCFKRNFRGLTKKWRIQIEEVANGLNHKHLLVHVVKEGETLTSISKHYGVSVYSIAAANKNIADVDLVLEGQHLNIPSSKKAEVQATEKDSLSGVDVEETSQLPQNIFNGLLDKKNFTMQIAYSSPHVKTTGYFLVLVPLIAVCVRCIIGAFQTRVAGDSGHQIVNESKGHHHGSKSMRWKSALRDIIEVDNMDSEAKPDSSDLPEDGAQTSFEEMSHAYKKLEHDYEKFLAECGMSKWGYWRGGSPE